MSLLRRADLYPFFEVFCSNSFYLIGAGASAPIIPLGKKLGQEVKSIYKNIGCYPPKTYEPSETVKRILEPSEREDYILQTMSPRMLDLIATYKLSINNIHCNCPQYEIFRFAKPSIIFNMNVDGLAERYCQRRHTLLSPHGTIQYQLTKFDWIHLIEGANVYGVYPPKNDILLPQPEPKNITCKEQYRRAISYFPYAKYFIVIGYSFGLYREKEFPKETLDDIETFDFFIELLKTYKKHILIIDPEPGYAAHVLQETIKEKATIIRVSWSWLTQSMIDVMIVHKCPFKFLSKHTDKIIRRYFELSDSPN
jgi:hypothetical protein